MACPTCAYFPILRDDEDAESDARKNAKSLAYLGLTGFRAAELVDAIESLLEPAPDFCPDCDRKARKHGAGLD
jgi:hypothetical protein